MTAQPESMPIDRETIRRTAAEILRLPLAEGEVEPLRSLIRALLDEIGPIHDIVRDETDPAVGFDLEAWD